MKTLLNVLIGLSIVGSGALAYALLQPESRPAALSAPAAAPAAAAPKTPGAETWSRLNNEDLGQLAANLREAEFPPHIVRAIIAAQIGAEFDERRKAIDAARSDMFWKSSTEDAAKEKQLRELNREQARRLRTVLGDEGDIQVVYEDRGLEILPAAKAALAKDIIRRFSEESQEFYARWTAEGGSGGMDMAQKMDSIARAQREELAKVLSPSELEEYELRASSTAQQMRWNLSAFNPTETEFRAIFALQREFENKYGRYGLPIDKGRAEAQKQLVENVKLALGAERGAYYAKATDSSYRTTSQLVARLALPPETTDQLYALQQEVTKRQKDIYAGAGDRVAAVEELKALEQEAAQKAAKLLGGERNLDVYKRYGGSWLLTAVPRTP